MASRPLQNPNDLICKKLCDLYPEIADPVLVVALVIAKTEPNVFLSKNDTLYKGVMNFTLRDAKHHLVNCKCWGSREKIEEYDQLIKIGDIVDVTAPRVTAINLGAVDMQQPRYQPLGTLPFALILNEGQGFMQKHSFHDLQRYEHIKRLAQQSHKPLYCSLNLADAKASYATEKSRIYYADFLVIVGLIRPAREIRSAKAGGRVRHCLELVVFDESLPGGIIMTLWHEEWQQRAQQQWRVMETVLHLCDIKISYSEFYKGCILSHTSRSILYENPMGQEAKRLKEYAQSIPRRPFEVFAQTGVDALPRADDIHTTMTVRQIYARAEGQLCDNSEQFTAVLYAMVTRFDIDWPSMVLGKRCNACNRLMTKNQVNCDQQHCQLTFSFNDTGDHFEYFFNLNVRLSDHTGTLIEARLTDTIAAKLLCLSCTEYLKLADKDLERLKYSYLLQHFQVKLLIRKPNLLRRKLIAMIVDMKAIDIEELAKNIIVF